MNLSKSELELLLTSLQERLDQLKQSGQGDMNHRTGRPLTSRSMYNLDQIDDLLSPMSNGKSLTELNESRPGNVPGTSRLSAVSTRSVPVTRNIGTLPYSPSLFPASTSVASKASYRRFAYNKRDPNFSQESFWAKRQAAEEYRKELDEQIEQKRRAEMKQSILARLTEAVLDQKVEGQQRDMREEFQHEHHSLEPDQDGEYSDQRVANGGNRYSARKLPLINQNSGKNPQKSVERPVTPPPVHSHSHPQHQASNSRHLHLNHAQTQTDNSLLVDLVTDLMADISIRQQIQKPETKPISHRRTKSTNPVKLPTTASSTTEGRSRWR